MKTVEDFRQWLSERVSGVVNITDEVQLDTYEMIKTSERIKHGQFQNPKYPDGMDKLIFNLYQILSFTLYRFSDKDAKELGLLAQTDEGLRNINFFKSLLRGYLYDANYDTEMNHHRRNLIEDGHIMTLELNNTSYRIPLLNVVRDWSEPNLEETGCAIKDPSTNKKELERIYEKMEDGDAKKQLRLLLDDEKIKDNDIITYSWFTEDTFEENGKETKGIIKYLCTRRTETTDIKMETGSQWIPYCEIDRFESPETRVTVDLEEIAHYKELGLLEGENRVPAYPIKEARFFTRDGHALGYGIPLIIQGLIEFDNELMNDLRRHIKGAGKGGKFVYKRNTKDRSITQDVINALDVNNIIEIKQGEDFHNLPVQSITADHLAIADRIFDRARQTLGIAPSAIIEPKASQSATSAAYEQENAKSTYAIIGETLNLFYQELFRDFKIPSMIENLSKKKALKLIGTREEIESVKDQFTTNSLNGQLPNAPKMMFNKSTLDMETEMKLKKALTVKNNKEGTTLILPALKKKVLELFDYDVIFYSGSTMFDKKERLELYNQLIQDALQNPNSEYSFSKINDAKFDLFDIETQRFKKSPEEMHREQVIRQQIQQQQQAELANLPNTSVV